ncbi:MAG: hypothetical protein ACKV2T_19470 [Kofleriaceae bacterium]
MVDLLVDAPDDELSRVLYELRWLVIKYPLAAQAAYRTLLAEGQRFASTSDGAAWRARVEGSELVRRGRSIFELGTLGLLDDSAVLPTEMIDAFARAAGRRDLEAALAQRLEPDALALEEETT